MLTVLRHAHSVLRHARSVLRRAHGTGVLGRTASLNGAGAVSTGRAGLHAGDPSRKRRSRIPFLSTAGLLSGESRTGAAAVRPRRTRRTGL